MRESVVANYLCGDNSFCCNKFYYLCSVGDVGRECILCDTCYYANSNNSLWVIYNVLGLNVNLKCDVVHIHGQSHFHCFKCLMDTRNSQRCLRWHVADINERYTYWTSEKFCPAIQ